MIAASSSEWSSNESDSKAIKLQCVSAADGTNGQSGEKCWLWISELAPREITAIPTGRLKDFLSTRGLRPNIKTRQ